MAQLGQNMAVSPAAGAAGARLATEAAPRGMIVFLNALPLNSLPRRHIQVDILPVGINDLANWIQRRLAEGYELIHYIRHPATVAALRSAGVPLSEQPNSGLYQHTPGDVIVVVTLRSPQRGQEQAQVKPEDLETWIVTVL
jgi:hypothetical protein